MANLSAWSLPTALFPPLSGREAVVDAAYRAVLGLDTNDVKLFESAFTEDASININGNVTAGRKALVSGLFGKISKLDTTHYLTNIRINISDGETKAMMSASSMAQHFLGGNGMDFEAKRFTSGSLYLLDLVRDDKEGVWKVTSWKIQPVWGEGDVSIIM